METKLFQNIAGYERIKAELIDILNWYKKRLKNSSIKVSLPKGILFTGHPGNGKTLFVREYSKAFNCPIFNIEGGKDNLASEIAKTFEKARNEKMAVITIDEIDLLIKDNYNAERTLQTELDGINNRGNIIVLATTNNSSELNDAFKRPGRFDRLIRIFEPYGKDLKTLLIYFLDELKINKNNLEIENLSNLFNGCSCSDIKAIVNDAYLRTSKVTTEELDTSYQRIYLHNYISYDPLEYKDYHVAIHEAGHAIMALRFKDDFNFYNAKFAKHGGGKTMAFEKEQINPTLKSRIENLQITLSGIAAEKIFFKKHDIGARQDIQDAYQLAERLITKTGIYGLDRYSILPHCEGVERSDSEQHHSENEKYIAKLIKKQQKLAYRYLKKHKDKIKAFADLLYKKGKVNLDDVNKLFPKGIDTTHIKDSFIPKVVTIN